MQPTILGQLKNSKSENNIIVVTEFKTSILYALLNV